MGQACPTWGVVGQRVRQERRHFEADVLVTPAGLSYTARGTSAVLNAADSELLVQRLCIKHPHVRRFPESPVNGAPGNGLFEDRRLGGHAP
jgi:hypothetical protein